MQLTINKKKNGFYTKHNAVKIQKQLDTFLQDNSRVKELNADATCKIDRRMKYQQIFTSNKKHKFYNILKHISPQYFIGQDGTVISVKNTITILSRGYRQPNQYGITRDQYKLATDYIETCTTTDEAGKKVKKQHNYNLAIESYMLTALVFEAGCSDRVYQLILTEGIKALNTPYMLEKYGYAINAHHNMIDFKDCKNYKQANNPNNIFLVSDKAHNAILRGKTKDLSDFESVTGEFIRPYAIMDNTLYLDVSNKIKHLENKKILNTDDVLKKLIPDNYCCINPETKEKLNVKIDQNPSVFMLPEDFDNLQEILKTYRDRNISCQGNIDFFRFNHLGYIVRESYSIIDNDNNKSIDLYIIFLI